MILHYGYNQCSLWEIPEFICSIIVLPHTDAANGVADECGNPFETGSFSVEVIDPPSLYYIFSKSTIHIMEIEMLIGWWSRVSD